MMVRRLSHAFPAGAVQRPRPTDGDSAGQAMGTPAAMAHQAEKSEQDPHDELLRIEATSPTVAAATQDAIARLHPFA